MRLDQFNRSQFDRGKPMWVEAVWVVIQALLFSAWFPGSFWRRWLLKSFGAEIGTDVVIKPGVSVKFPWRLQIGNYSWIGEKVWIDNLADVTVGANVCISQGAYLCTGSHDVQDEQFRLITKPIVIEESAWISAFVKIAPGVTVRKASVVELGSVLTQDTEEASVYFGVPASFKRKRFLS